MSAAIGDRVPWHRAGSRHRLRSSWRANTVERQCSRRSDRTSEYRCWTATADPIWFSSQATRSVIAGRA